MNSNQSQDKKERQKRQDFARKIRLYESLLRTIGFIASLILAGIAIHEHIDSPVVWAFLGYAIGSSSAGIKSI